MKRFITIALLLSLLLSLFACNPDNAAQTTSTDSSQETGKDTTSGETQQTVWDTSSELDVTHIKSESSSDGGLTTVTFPENSDAFGFKNATADGSVVTLAADTVSALSIARKFSDNTTAYYEFFVNSACTQTQTPWFTLYFGFRLSESTADATSQSGIWITVRNDTIGLRTNTWPETTYMKLTGNITFASQRMIYFEDDMTNDVITVYADDDSGMKTRIAMVKLEDGYINMYQPDASKPSITDKITDSINTCGYTNVWLHIANVKTVIDKIKISGSTTAQNEATANMLNSKDTFSDTWVCVDDEGRATVSDNTAVSGQKVGIFYFLWHNGTSANELYDHSAAYYNGGTEALEEMIKAGPLGFAHYWAQPYFGYYRSDDAWVIRKHAQMLTESGVDFIFIDATNGLTYEQNYETVFKVWNEMRLEGYDTPQIMFHCGNDDGNAGKSFTALWNNLYSQGRYEDLWFKWDGKPLILMPKTYYKTLTDEQQSFFTYRQSWAYTKDSSGTWYTKTKGKNCWPWADMYPQSPGKSAEGDIEQMIVMCGFWVNGSYGTNAGRSYHNGKQPDNLTDSDYGFSLLESSGKGYAFEEQFDYAIEADVPLIMITGWNEWWAGRWEGEAAKGQTIANTYTVTLNDPLKKNYFVDNFNSEFSRDIEPVSGLFNDNYYYQMAQNVRQYKGSRAGEAAFGQRSIDLDGSVGQWYAVGPEFRDYEGDTAYRKSMSYVGRFRYINETGRNDFVTAKVSSDSEYLYFYAECADNITSAEGSNWMNLFIDADNDASTGWYGYDFVLNRSQSADACSVQRFVNNAWELEDAGSAEYRVNGKYIQIKVSRALLKTGETFDFKWADNSVDDGDIMQFLDLGDCAPDARFNYRYTTVKTGYAVPACLKNDMIVLKSGSYNAYVNGEEKMLDASNTNCAFVGGNGKYYVPKAFAAEVIGLDVSSSEVLNHYGTEYVEISAALAASGKTVTEGENILVIGADCTEEELLTLYRNLH